MLIFVIGGGGILGRHLGYHLACQHHEVYLFDIDTTDINRNIIPNDHIYKMPSGRAFEILNSFTINKRPQVIFHLAETATVDTITNIQAIHDNIGLTSDVLNVCARYNIRGIIGTWEPIDNIESSLLVHSLNQKSELIKYFHKGNVVVNEVRIPQIVHPGYPSIKYGALLNRLVYHIEYGEPFYIGNECESYSSVRSFNSLFPIVEHLTQIMKRNTRSTITIEGYRYPLDYLISFALHAHDVETVTLVSRGEPRVFHRRECNRDNPIYRWITEQDWK